MQLVANLVKPFIINIIIVIIVIIVKQSMKTMAWLQLWCLRISKERQFTLIFYRIESTLSKRRKTQHYKYRNDSTCTTSYTTWYNREVYHTAALRQSGPDLCRELMKIKTRPIIPRVVQVKVTEYWLFFEFVHKSSKIEIFCRRLDSSIN